MTTPTPLADRIRAILWGKNEWAADEVAVLEREAARMSKLIRIPETEQEVEALEDETTADRALNLLCAIRGVESVVVKHETLCGIRDRIASLERENAELREKIALMDETAASLTKRLRSRRASARERQHQGQPREPRY